MTSFITITSLINVTKITSQKFFQFGPFPIKISGYAIGLGLIIWWSLKKAVLVLKKWSWSWPNRSWSWKNRWSCSSNLVVLLHHWSIYLYLNKIIAKMLHLCADETYNKTSLEGFYRQNFSWSQGCQQKIFQGKGANEKKKKFSKKIPKIALFSLFQGGREGRQRKKDRKIAKKGRKIAKKSTFKPLSTIFVPCLKIQRGMPPCCRRPWLKHI